MKSLITILLFLSTSCVMFSQQINQIRGFVRSHDDKQELKNVKVILIDLGVVTMTDSEGQFVINGYFEAKKSYNFSFYKEGYKAVSSMSLKVNEEGATEVIHLWKSSRHGLSFLVKEGSAQEHLINNAKISINSNDYYTDENGYCFVEINDMRLLNGVPIVYSISKQSYGTKSGEIVYEEGKKFVEVSLPIEDNQGLKIIVKDAKTKLLLKKVKVSVDGKTQKTDEMGYVFFKNISAGHMTVSTKKGFYKDSSMSVKFNGKSKAIIIEIHKVIDLPSFNELPPVKLPDNSNNIFNNQNKKKD